MADRPEKSQHPHMQSVDSCCLEDSHGGLRRHTDVSKMCPTINADTKTNIYYEGLRFITNVKSETHHCFTLSKTDNCSNPSSSSQPNLRFAALLMMIPQRLMAKHWYEPVSRADSGLLITRFPATSV